MYLWEGWGKSNSGLGVGSGEYLLPTLLPRAFDGLIAQESGEGPGDLVVNRHPALPEFPGWQGDRPQMSTVSRSEVVQREGLGNIFLGERKPT